MNTVMHLPHFYCHHHFHNHCCQFIYCHYLFITCMLGVLCLAISRLHHIYTKSTPNLHGLYTISHCPLYCSRLRPYTATTPPTPPTPPTHRLHTTFVSSSHCPQTTLPHHSYCPPQPPPHCYHSAPTPPHTPLHHLYTVIPPSPHRLTLPPLCLHSAPTALFHHFYTASTVPPTAYPHRLHTAPTPHSHRLSIALHTVLIIPQTALTLHLCCLHIMLTPSSLAPTHCFRTTISLHSHFIHPHCIHTTLLLFLHHAFTAFTPHSHSIHQQTQKFHQQLPC